MSIRLQCATCETAYVVSEQHRGRRLKCKSCGSTIRIPTGTGEASDLAPLAEDFTRPAATRTKKAKRRKKPNSSVRIATACVVAGIVVTVAILIRFVFVDENLDAPDQQQEIVSVDARQHSAPDSGQIGIDDAAQQPTETSNENESASDVQNDASIARESHLDLEAILSVSTNLEFAEAPLSEVLQAIREVHQLPIVADEALVRDKVVTFALGLDPSLSYEISLRSVLQEILEREQLGMIVETDQITIVPFDASLSSTVDGTVDTSSGRTILQALDQLTFAEFSGFPLRDVLDFLSELHGIPIHGTFVSNQLDATIDVQLSGVSLRTALNSVLDELELSYVVKNEMLRIVPASEVDPLRDIANLSRLDSTAWSERLHEALNQTTSFDGNGRSLHDIVESIEQLHAIEIVWAEREIAERGISPDAPVGLSIQNVTLRQLLERLLQPVGLTFIVDEEVLRIVPQPIPEQQ